MTYQDLKGFENDYEIWSEAPYMIKNKKNGKIIKEYVHNNGYVRCKLNGKNYQKHRLIANQFIPNPDNLPQVNHIDGNKSNNIVTNLEWCTEKENQKHRIEVLHKDMIGENNPMFGVSGSKSPVYKGLIYQHDMKTGEIINSYEGSGEAAKAVDGKASGVIRVLNLPNRSYKGYRWTRND